MNRKTAHLVFVTFLFTFILFAGISNSATALSTYWRHDPLTPGSWHDLANWDNGIPTSEIYAYIDNGGTVQITADAFSHNLYLGYDDFGAVEQTGGTNTIVSTIIYNIGGYLFLGYDPDSNGTYNLSGTGQLTASSEYIGYKGTGEFNQSGGTNTVANDLYLGVISGSSGTYNLSGGQLLADEEYIGNRDTGEFNQSGGSNTANYFLYLGWYSGSSGTYNLSGTGQLTANEEYIGRSGIGEFNQTGGTNTVDDDLYLGKYSGSSGTYNLSGGQLSANRESIGCQYGYGIGEFNQTGGTNTVGCLFVKDSGSYTLSGGTLSIGASAKIDGSFHFADGDWTLNVEGGLANFANATIDSAGSASFNSAANTLTIFSTGFDPVTEFGSYSASGLVHNAGNTLIVPVGKGFAGIGTINDPVENHGSIVASGGSLQFKNDITILDGGTLDLGSCDLTVDNGHTATIAASGGQLSAYREYIGGSGTGEFNQSGGTNTIGSSLSLSSGTYNLSAGQLLAKVESIGSFSTSEFNQSGGTNTIGSSLQLGYSSGFNGTYNLSGTGQLLADYEYIGRYGGTGEFNQSGGTNTGNYLYIGYSSSGTYNLSAGQLSAIDEYIGSSGIGEFNQTGGTNTVDGNLRLGGDYSDSSGTYRLSGSAVLHVNGSMRIGTNSGDGRFEWFEGVLNTPTIALGSKGVLAIGHDISIDDLVSGSLFGGTLSGLDLAKLEITNGCTVMHNLDAVVVKFTLIGTATGNGMYNLGGAGQLSARYERIGYNGTGEFNQSGGTNTVHYNLYLGYETGSSGTYNLVGGQLSANEEHISYGGTGEFNQSGGINTVCEHLYLGYEAGSSGTYNLSGTGQLSVHEEYIGYEGTGEFNQDDGTHTVNGHLHLGRNSISSGTYNLSTGQLSAGYEHIGYNGTGEFNQSGGINTVENWLYLGYRAGSSGTYNLSGGQLSGRYEFIGCDGTGEFNQTGGVNTVSDTLYIGHGSASGVYNLQAGEISAFRIIIGENGYFANNGSLGGGEILSLGNFTNNSVSPELFRMTHTTLTMWGGMDESLPAILDMNSGYMGADCAGLVDNFALGTLVFEGSSVASPGFYYRLDSDVYTYGLVLNDGAVLDLNGHNLYYLPLGQTYNGIATTTQCLGGSWYGGDIVALSGDIIPEPTALLLLVPGILGIAIRVRRGSAKYWNHR